MYNPFTLEGKTILVTGASSGIGRETAIQCSKLGATVILTARNHERLQETLNEMTTGSHLIIDANLVNSEDIEHLVSKTPLLDGLVLCAGKLITAPLLYCTRKKFDELFDINFFSTIELLRLLVKKKKMSKNSSIVIVSSVGGVNAFTLGNGIYGSSKAALNASMKFCAKELAGKKIRVNSVNPGMVNTNLIQEGAVSEEQHKLDMENYPLKRYGEPIDIALGIIYLLSDASSWVTGHSLVIDGGITI